MTDHMMENAMEADGNFWEDEPTAETKPTKKPEHSPLPLCLIEESNGEEFFLVDFNEMTVAEILTGPVDGERFVRRVNSGNTADELAKMVIRYDHAPNDWDGVNENDPRTQMVALARQYQAT